MIIAIDGPAGSGKSTVAKLLAEKLSFLYLDTGAMYRALTYWLIKNNINPCLEERVAEELKKIDIEFKEEKIFLNGEDVSLKIRQPLIEESISPVAKNPQVREIMVIRQRETASSAFFRGETFLVISASSLLLKSSLNLFSSILIFFFLKSRALLFTLSEKSASKYIFTPA